MENNRVVDIATDQIYSHPDNPRKDLGDLSELSESIKKNGVMQNLTVIQGHKLTDEEWKSLCAAYREHPDEDLRNEMNSKWSSKGYTLLIGHRRCAAAKLAGILEMPCKIIEELSVKDQISTMLEENMQRNDLTIYEQAQGFQMMLDLGDSEGQIAEKTGFSKATIKHRLNIAKLNQKELQKKEKDESFQLTLKDLYELEKIEDVKTRDKILKEANSSRDLVSRAQNAVAEAQREACKKTIIGLLKKLGAEKAPREAENEIWSAKWKTVKEYDLEKDAPKQLKLPNEQGQMYWLVHYRVLRVIIKAPKKEKEELSKCELEKKEHDSAKRKINAILKESSSRRKEFIQNIISGKIDPVKNESEIKDSIWEALVALDGYIYKSTLSEFFISQDYYKCTEEEKQDAKEKSETLSILHQMMVVLHSAMKSKDELVNYQGKIIKERADALLKGYAALEPYGWYFESEEEKTVLDGTHESYKKEEEKKNE